MIGIGVNENLYLKSATLNEKNSLEIVFADIATAQEKKSIFGMLSSSSVEEMSGDFKLLLFPSLPSNDATRTEEKKLELVGMDLNGTKAILYHFMERYITTKEAEGSLDLFRGLGMTEDNYKQLMLSKDVLVNIHRNMCNDFIAKMRDFIGKPEFSSRLLLVRQSKDKPYASLRRRYLDSFPFWESSDISKEQSKLYKISNPAEVKLGKEAILVPNFSKYEIDNGLTDSTPVSKSDNDKTDTSASASNMSAASVFGG